MSRRAWTVFGTSCTFAASTVFYVHWAQENDRTIMNRAVLNEIAREEAEKAKENATADCPTGICDIKPSSPDCPTGICDVKPAEKQATEDCPNGICAVKPGSTV
mmetsp:Transcript_18999/g.33789  ORF Transcript_18999/g.33789 Transcript_18999/m.33789 type:complete len:104 (+) Transcript_18999:2-313(+)